jgi:phosphate transport system substrate-binding protein
MGKILSIILCTALLVSSAIVCSAAQTRLSIRVNGADSMYGRIMSLSQLYMKDHLNVDITVEKNALVEDGIRALIDGKAEVAMASRILTVRENIAARSKGVHLVEHLIGYGGIVIITHPTTAIGEITIDQVRRLLKGECVNWKELDAQYQPVVVFKTVDKHPGTLQFVQNSILAGAHIAKSAQEVPDFPALMEKVAETPGAIKVLKIKKDDVSPPVSPSRKTVLDGSYPLRRTYSLYTSRTADKGVRAFVDYVVSKGWGSQD